MTPPAPVHQSTQESVLSIRNLRKAYGEVRALESVSFEVRRGDVTGLIGPNGSGKTTTVEAVEKLCPLDGGTIDVFGQPVGSYGPEMFNRVGVQLQADGGLPAALRVGEALALAASHHLAPLPLEVALDKIKLTDKRTARFSSLSSGQKRRLLLGLALIGKPELLILDEPTSGLDPNARFELWQVIHSFVQGGGTVLVTTHYMEEAQQECDSIVFINSGRTVHQGSPLSIVRDSGIGSVVELKKQTSDEVGATLRQLLPTAVRVSEFPDRVRIYVKEGFDPASLEHPELAGLVSLKGTHPASLNDIFLYLTERNPAHA